MGKNPSTCQCRRHETWLQSLDQEDPLDEEMALQYSSLGNPLENRAWQATVHGVTQGQTQLSTRACMHSDYFKKKKIATPSPTHSSVPV